jgi:hypothetical protein
MLSSKNNGNELPARASGGRHGKDDGAHRPRVGSQWVSSGSRFHSARQPQLNPTRLMRPSCGPHAAPPYTGCTGRWSTKGIQASSAQSRRVLTAEQGSCTRCCFTLFPLSHCPPRSQPLIRMRRLQFCGSSPAPLLHSLTSRFTSWKILLFQLPPTGHRAPLPPPTHPPGRTPAPSPHHHPPPQRAPMTPCCGLRAH